ncbi:hypothetical protein ERJ75_000166900 [Trypanosoma vivax]|nr:hypothetical protein ERJ75_000166900 [Trypanosoma vivax]
MSLDEAETVPVPTVEVGYHERNHVRHGQREMLEVETPRMVEVGEYGKPAKSAGAQGSVRAALRELGSDAKRSAHVTHEGKNDCYTISRVYARARF